MNTLKRIKIVMSVSIALTGAIAFADEPGANSTPVQRPHLPPIPHHGPPAIPAPEPTTAATASTLANTSTLTAKSESVSPQATTLSPPVTLTYSGSSNAITVTDSGTGRGISSTVTNTNSGSSALFGSTAGSGAGLTGFNSGTGGPAGKFQITNANSAQAGVYATTNGTGSAIVGISTNPSGGDPNSTTGVPAIYGIADTTTGYGIGVEGAGQSYGVYGINTNELGIGVYGVNSFAGGYGVVGSDFSSDASGIGVQGYSSNGMAGYFLGNVTITGSLTVGSTTYPSDRNLKADVTPIDGPDLLNRVGSLPITSWDYKTDSKKRHIGPMAQDFHAAFGLNGDDETHISEVDIAGVSLAAIQELNRRMKEKDAQIAGLKAQLFAQNKATIDQFAQMRAAIKDLKADTMSQGVALTREEDTIRRSAIEIATLKQALAAQKTKVAKDTAGMAQQFSARLATLEQKQSAGLQTAALRTQHRSTMISTQ